MKEFIAHFEALVNENKLEEAKTLLSTLASRPVTTAERAAQKLYLTDLYVRLSNIVSQSYLDALNEGIAKLKYLESKDKEIDEKAKLMQARFSLAE